MMILVGYYSYTHCHDKSEDENVIVVLNVNNIHEIGRPDVADPSSIQHTRAIPT